MVKGIVGFLSALSTQGGKGLDTLVIDERYVVLMLFKAAAGEKSGGCRVKKLVLSLGCPRGEDQLARILYSGLVVGVEELSLGNSASGWRSVLKALGQGACPDLVRLSVKGSREDGCQGLASALRSGYCHKLQELTLLLREGYPLMVFAAIREGSCPNLTKINLGKKSLHPADAHGLGALLSSSACPKLSALLLGGMELSTAGAVRVVEALLGRNFSDLTCLRFGSVSGRSEPALGALARVLSSGIYSHLQELHLGSESPWTVGDSNGDSTTIQGLTWILDAVGAGFCQELRYLGINSAAPMDNVRARMLGQVLQNGACPLLEDLDLGRNGNLNGEGFATVMHAVNQGACPRLRRINLHSTSIRSKGAAALVEALTRGSLRHLQHLDLTHTGIGDESTRNILQALANCCRDLRKIALIGTGASSQALAAFHQALKDRVWVRLENVNLCYDDETVAGDLVSALAVTGVGTSLRHMELQWRVYQGVVVQRLADTFRQGACPDLRELVFYQIGSYPRFEEFFNILCGSLAGRARVKAEYV